MAERLLPKQKVASSSLVSRSNTPHPEHESGGLAGPVQRLLSSAEKRPLLAASLALALALSATPAIAAPAPAAALPNLAINTARVASSIVFKTQMFASKDCAYIEGSLTGTGKRTLLRFDVSTANRGGSPIVLGNPVGNPLFAYSACHRHYHFGGYALYELFAVDPRVTSSAPVLTGRKQAFCLEDYEVDPLAVSSGPAVYTCSNQGISVGWADTYGSYLDGQWLDITGIRAGAYWLRVTVNPYNINNNPYYDPNSLAALALAESSYADNVAVVPVTIPVKIAGGHAN